MKERTYIAIDLKSFYASVELQERNLNALENNLVVADNTRTEKTICLAVSPSLKSFGIPGRPRLFQVIEKVKYANFIRQRANKNKEFKGSSVNIKELNSNPDLKIDYIVAKPRMALYMDYSTRIYKIYLKYVDAKDMHIYSIDEVFIDATDYLKASGKTPKEFAMAIIKDVLKETGITATAGIGTNLYLAKIAMDIVAKHKEADENGVRIAQLNQYDYRELLWDYEPITDFWRVGKGYYNKLKKHGLYTMGDIARCSLGCKNEYYNEDLIYRLFGVNGELLIDHAWGYEPCTIADIKAYKPKVNSLCSGQVLQEPYDWKHARLVATEMADLLSIDLLAKGLVTNQMTLTIGYDILNIDNPDIGYKGEVVIDNYGRKIPKHSHGTWNFSQYTSSTTLIVEGIKSIFDKISNPKLLVRRINISVNNLILEEDAKSKPDVTQMSIFDLMTSSDSTVSEESLKADKEIQKAVLEIKRKFGKNAVVKGMNLEEGATAISRNKQIGGHKA